MRISAPRSEFAPTINSGTSPLHLLRIQTAAPNVKIEHLCPLDIFHLIIEDYVELIYPISPIAHYPSFGHKLSSRQYKVDPEFLRLCLSLCAMTVSSIHRKISLYGFGHYSDAKQVVMRAYKLVIASRLMTFPQWAEDPSTDTLISSLLLGMASHFTESPVRGGNIINESIQCSRNLNL